MEVFFHPYPDRLRLHRPTPCPQPVAIMCEDAKDVAAFASYTADSGASAAPPKTAEPARAVTERCGLRDAPRCSAERFPHLKPSATEPFARGSRGTGLVCAWER